MRAESAFPGSARAGARIDMENGCHDFPSVIPGADGRRCKFKENAIGPETDAGLSRAFNGRNGSNPGMSGQTGYSHPWDEIFLPNAQGASETGLSRLLCAQSCCCLFLPHLAQRCNGGQLRIPRARLSGFPVHDRLRRNAEYLRRGGNRQIQPFALCRKTFGAESTSGRFLFRLLRSDCFSTSLRHLFQLLLKGFHLALELGDLGAIRRDCFFRRLEFGAEFLADDAGDFTLQDVGDIGPGDILV